MWVRGLKPRETIHKRQQLGVAPYVGAWIETAQPRRSALRRLVAPYVGAWIETMTS